MFAVSPVESLRQYIHTNFERLGAYQAEVRETILVQNGHYCGRRFSCGDFLAVWFVEENEVKFYDAQGHVLETACLESIDLNAMLEAA